MGAPGPALKDPRLTAYINREVRSPEDLANVVKINLDRGADIIKVQATENAGQLDEDPRKQLYDERQIRVVVETAAEAGVTVVTGTDTAHGEGSMVRIGQELAELVEVGYTPMEALRAATLNGAEMLGIDDRTGRIAEGFEADLVVIPANPLTAIVQVQDPLVVVTDGRLVRNRLPFGVDE